MSGLCCVRCSLATNNKRCVYFRSVVCSRDFRRHSDDRQSTFWYFRKSTLLLDHPVFLKWSRLSMGSSTTKILQRLLRYSALYSPQMGLSYSIISFVWRRTRIKELSASNNIWNKQPLMQTCSFHCSKEIPQTVWWKCWKTMTNDTSQIKTSDLLWCYLEYFSILNTQYSQ